MAPVQAPKENGRNPGAEEALGEIVARKAQLQAELDEMNLQLGLRKAALYNLAAVQPREPEVLDDVKPIEHWSASRMSRGSRLALAGGALVAGIYLISGNSAARTGTSLVGCLGAAVGNAVVTTATNPRVSGALLCTTGTAIAVQAMDRGKVPEVYRLPRFRDLPTQWLHLIDAAVAVRRQEEAIAVRKGDDGSQLPVHHEVKTPSDLEVFILENTCTIPSLGVELVFMPGQGTLGVQRLRESWLKHFERETKVDDSVWRQFYLMLEAMHLQKAGDKVVEEIEARLNAELWRTGNLFTRLLNWRVSNPMVTSLRKFSENAVLRSMMAVARQYLVQYNGKQARDYLIRTLVPIFTPFVCSDVEHWVTYVVDFVIKVDDVKPYF